MAGNDRDLLRGEADIVEPPLAVALFDPAEEAAAEFDRREDGGRGVEFVD